MKCPHCEHEIDLSPTLWHLFYQEDIRKRIITQTGNPSIADLVAPKGCYGMVRRALQSIEDAVAAACLAWHRGTLSVRVEPLKRNQANDSE